MDETFTGILETARIASANRLITNGDHSVNQIAQKLGYSDQAHFTRAFRRWNDVSPAAFRRLQTASE
jgi:AraC-like DNA-binding protein